MAFAFSSLKASVFDHGPVAETLTVLSEAFVPRVTVPSLALTPMTLSALSRVLASIVTLPLSVIEGLAVAESSPYVTV